MSIALDELDRRLSKFEDATTDFQSFLYQMRQTIDEMDDHLGDCLRAFNEIPNEKLNQILRAGFVPGFQFHIDGFDGAFTVKGFTVGMRIDVIDPEGEVKKTDIDIIARLMDEGRIRGKEAEK